MEATPTATTQDDGVQANARAVIALTALAWGVEKCRDEAPFPWSTLLGLQAHGVAPGRRLLWRRPGGERVQAARGQVIQRA